MECGHYSLCIILKWEQWFTIYIFCKYWFAKFFYEQAFFEYHTWNGTNSTTIIYRSFWGLNKGRVETFEPLARGLSVNSIVDPLSLSFYWVTESLLNCTWGQLNNEGGGELNEIKRSRDKTEIGKETRGRSKRTSSQKWQFLDPLRPCHH